METMATAVLDEVQLAEARVCVPLSLKVPVATNCCVAPGKIDGAEGLTATDASPGGKLECVAGLNGTTERHWLGLTPDDCPLITRSIGMQEIYALTMNWP